MSRSPSRAYPRGMSLSYRGYDVVIRCLRGISPPLGLWNRSKLGRGIRGRLVSSGAFQEWARTYRDESRPLVWFHAPSVGEGLQAKAVMDALLKRSPDIQLAYTFFSPSAEGLMRRMPVHVAGYLPWDTRPEMEALLDALRPHALVFTKTEVWPVLSSVACERGVPTFLAAATLPEGAGRLRGPAAWFLRPAFSSLRKVLAISEGDGKRFRRLGVADGAVEVTGDPGVDSASRRVRGADSEASYLKPFLEDRRPTLVAGSTWPADEKELLPALEHLRRSVAGLRVILAPHEPTPSHVDAIERSLDRTGWKVARLGAIEAQGGAVGVDAVVVDRVGVLAALYTVGDIAFVGGGFHRHGLHSVLEPASAGVPVLFGPRHTNAQSAARLTEAGGGRVVTDRKAIAEIVGDWFGDPSERAAAGKAAALYIDQHLGAADRTARQLTPFLAGKPSRESGDEANATRGPSGG